MVAQETSVFRSQSTVVLVPTLVVAPSTGDIVYGLEAEDFLIRDNGIEQKVRLDDAPDSRPVSLIIVAQTGNHASAVLSGKDSGLGFSLRPGMGSGGGPAGGPGPGGGGAGGPGGGPGGMPIGRQLSGLGGVALMTEDLLYVPGSEMALVTFDSQATLAQDFTPDSDQVTRKLRSLSEGDSGNAILDALHYSLNLLEKRPKEHRRVIFLICELHDHGSIASNFNDVVHQFLTTNTELYSVAFSGNAIELKNLVSGKASNVFLGNLRSGHFMGMGGRGGPPGKGGGGGGMGGPGGGMGGPGGGMGGPGGGMGGPGGGMGGGSMAGGAASVTGATGAGGMSGAGGGMGMGGPGMGPGSMNPIQMAIPFIGKAVEAMKINVPQGVADLTGGEYIVFSNTHNFEDALQTLGNHAHNRYQLSFQVKEPTPGLHKLDVYVAKRDASVAARKGYLISVSLPRVQETPKTSETAGTSAGGED
jgi:hypothetical protein